MIELYHAHISTCSQKVRLCLAEKEIKWHGHAVNFALSEHLQDSYLKINPNGVVPSLVHNGDPVVDSSVICEYLQESHSSQGQALMPDDCLGRAKVRAWLRYIEEVPTAAIRVPSFNSLFKPTLCQQTDEQRAQYIEKTPLRKDMYRRFGKDGFSQQELDSSTERLEQTLSRMESSLQDQAWLAGKDYSLAEICVIPTLVRMEDIGLSYLWAKLPNVTDWYQRIQARPSFKQAYYPGARVVVGDAQVLSR